MSLSRYRHVLALPGVARLLVLGVGARIPLTAISVGLTLHVVGTLHRGYAEAGLLGTVSTIGLAFVAPVIATPDAGARRTLGSGSPFQTTLHAGRPARRAKIALRAARGVEITTPFGGPSR